MRAGKSCEGVCASSVRRIGMPLSGARSNASGEDCLAVGACARGEMGEINYLLSCNPVCYLEETFLQGNSMPEADSVVSAVLEPKFSVVCPVFNTDPEMLRAAVASVLLQEDGQDIELLLIDDASTNAATIQALLELSANDGQIRLIRMQENGGPSKARKLGLEKALGEWITFLDSDDLWPEGAHRKRKNIICSNSAIEWLSANTATLNAKGVVVNDPVDPWLMAPPSENTAYKNGKKLTEWLIASSRFHLGSQCIKAKILRGINAFEEKLDYGEDWLFFIRLSVISGCHISSETFYILRRQHESLMTSSKRSTILYASCKYIAMQDPLLTPFKREVRWSLYSTLKGLALDNAIQKHTLRALNFAFRALMLDPRELSDFFTLCRVLLVRDSVKRIALGRRYSAAEIRTDLLQKF